MNRHDLQSAAAKLERSGVRFYSADSTDGANIARWRPVDWQTAIGRLISVTGWVVGPDVEETEGPELKLVPTDGGEG